MPEGFLGRWSRRKQEAREDVHEAPAQESTLPPASPAAPVAPILASDPDNALATQSAPPPAGLSQENAQASAPPLTLADVDALDIASDYKPFVARQVAPEVRNAAFRKLFADPHFNVMDGLDTYVEDYSKTTPLPDSVLRQMASAKFLALLDNEPEGIPPETPEAVGTVDVAQSGDSGKLPSPPVADAQPASHETDDHHADLRLQPDDAARAEDTRRGIG